MTILFLLLYSQDPAIRITAFTPCYSLRDSYLGLLNSVFLVPMIMIFKQGCKRKKQNSQSSDKAEGKSCCFDRRRLDTTWAMVTEVTTFCEECRILRKEVLDPRRFEGPKKVLGSGKPGITTYSSMVHENVAHPYRSLLLSPEQCLVESPIVACWRQPTIDWNSLSSL